ncbi:MAG: hypothetical protein WCH10_00485 [bacterium]
MIPDTRKLQKKIKASKEEKSSFSEEQKKAIAYAKQIRAINSANALFKKREHNTLNRDKYYEFLSEADDIALEKLKKIQNNDANEIDDIWSIFNILEKTLALKKELDFKDGIATISVEVQGRFLEVTIKKDPNSKVIPGTNIPEEFKIIGLSQYWWKSDWDDVQKKWVRPNLPKASFPIIELGVDQPVKVKMKDGLISAYSPETGVEIIKDQFIDRDYQADLMLKTVGLEVKDGQIKKIEKTTPEHTPQLITAGTGVGKTGVIVTTALMHGDGIFAVPSDALVDQMCDDANDFIKDIDKSKNPLAVKLPKSIVDNIDDVKSFLKKHKYVVMTHEQLIKYANVIENRHVFIDEAHTLIPRSFEAKRKKNVSEALDKIAENNTTLCTTATPTNELEKYAVSIEDFSLYKTQHEEKMVRPVDTEDNLADSKYLSKIAAEELLLRETKMNLEMKGYSNSELEKNYRLGFQVQGLVFTDDPTIGKEIYEKYLSESGLSQLSSNPKALDSKKKAIKENIEAISKIEIDIKKNTEKLIKESNKNLIALNPDDRRDKTKVNKLNTDIERLNRRKEAVIAEIANLTNNTLEETGKKLLLIESEQDQTKKNQFIEDITNINKNDIQKDIVEAQKKIIDYNIKIDIIVNLNTSLLPREELEKLARNKKYEDLDAEYISSLSKYKEKKNNWKLSQILMKDPGFKYFYEKNLQSEIDKKIEKQITKRNLSAQTSLGITFSKDDNKVRLALSNYVKARKANSKSIETEKAKAELLNTFSEMDKNDKVQKNNDARINKMYYYYIKVEGEARKEFYDLTKKGEFSKLTTDERKKYSDGLLATEIKKAAQALEKHLKNPQEMPKLSIKENYEKDVIQHEKNQEKLKGLIQDEKTIGLINQNLTKETECEKDLNITKEKITGLKKTQQETSEAIAKLELIKKLSEKPDKTFLKDNSKALGEGIDQIHASEKQKHEEKLKVAENKEQEYKEKIDGRVAEYIKKEEEEKTTYEDSIKDHEKFVESLLLSYGMEKLCDIKNLDYLQTNIVRLIKPLSLPTNVIIGGTPAKKKFVGKIISSAIAMRDYPENCKLRKHEYDKELEQYNENLKKISGSIDLLKKEHKESENKFNELIKEITQENSVDSKEKIANLSEAILPKKEIDSKILEYTKKLEEHNKELKKLEEASTNTENKLELLKKQTLDKKNNLEAEISEEHKEKVKAILEEKETSSSEKNIKITAILAEIKEAKKAVDSPPPNEQIINNYNNQIKKSEIYQEKTKEYNQELEELRKKQGLDIKKITELTNNETQYIKLKKITEILEEIKKTEEKLEKEKTKIPPDQKLVDEYEKQHSEKCTKFEKKREEYKKLKSDLAPDVEQIDVLLKNDEKCTELIKTGKEIPLADFNYENEKEEAPVLADYYNTVVEYYNKELELIENEKIQTQIRESEEKIRKAKEILTTHSVTLPPEDIQLYQQIINNEQKNINDIRENSVGKNQKAIVAKLQSENSASELLLLENPKITKDDSPEKAKEKAEAAAKTNDAREQKVKALLAKGLRMFVISDGLLGTGYSNPNLQNTVLVQNKSTHNSPPDINLIIKCIQQYGRAIRSEEGISFVASVINQNLPEEERILTSKESFGEEATNLYKKKLAGLDAYYLKNLDGLEAELLNLKNLEPKLLEEGDKNTHKELLKEVTDTLISFAIIPVTEVELFLEKLKSFNQRIEDQYHVTEEIKKHLNAIELIETATKSKIDNTILPELGTKKVTELNTLAKEIAELKSNTIKAFETQLQNLNNLLTSHGRSEEIKTKINTEITNTKAKQSSLLKTIDTKATELKKLTNEQESEDQKIRDLIKANNDKFEPIEKNADAINNEIKNIINDTSKDTKHLIDLQTKAKSFFDSNTDLLEPQLKTLTAALINAKTGLAEDARKGLEAAIELVTRIQGNHFDHLKSGLETLKTSIDNRDTAEKNATESIRKITLIDENIQKQLTVVQEALNAKPEKEIKELKNILVSTREFITITIENLEPLQRQSLDIGVPEDLRTQLAKALLPAQTKFNELRTSLEKVENQQNIKAAVTIQSAFRGMLKGINTRKTVEKARASTQEIDEANKSIATCRTDIKNALSNITSIANVLEAQLEEAKSKQSIAINTLQSQHSLLEADIAQESDQALQGLLKNNLDKVNTTLGTTNEIKKEQNELESMIASRRVAESNVETSERAIGAIFDKVKSKVSTIKEKPTTKITAKELDNLIIDINAFVEQTKKDLIEAATIGKSTLPYLEERLNKVLSLAQQQLKNLEDEQNNIKQLFDQQTKKDNQATAIIQDANTKVAGIKSKIEVALAKATSSDDTKALDLKKLTEETLLVEKEASTVLDTQSSLLANIDKTGLSQDTETELGKALTLIDTTQKINLDLTNKRKYLEKLEQERDLKDQNTMLLIKSFNTNIKDFEKDINAQIEIIRTSQQDPSKSEKELKTILTDAEKFAKEKIDALQKQLKNIKENTPPSASDEVQLALKNAEQDILKSIDEQQKALRAELNKLNTVLKERKEKDAKIEISLIDLESKIISITQKITALDTKQTATEKNLQDLKADIQIIESEIGALQETQKVLQEENIKALPEDMQKRLNKALIDTENIQKTESQKMQRRREDLEKVLPDMRTIEEHTKLVQAETTKVTEASQKNTAIAVDVLQLLYKTNLELKNQVEGFLKSTSRSVSENDNVRSSIATASTALSLELNKLTIALNELERLDNARKEEDRKIGKLADDTKLEFEKIETKIKPYIKKAPDSTAENLEKLINDIQLSEKNLTDLKRTRQELESHRNTEARDPNTQEIIIEIKKNEETALQYLQTEREKLTNLKRSRLDEDKKVELDIEQHLNTIKQFIETTIKSKNEEIARSLEPGIKKVVELNPLADETTVLKTETTNFFVKQLQELTALSTPNNFSEEVNKKISTAIQFTKDTQGEQQLILDDWVKKLRALSAAQGLEDERIKALVEDNNTKIDPVGTKAKYLESKIENIKNDTNKSSETLTLLFNEAGTLITDNTTLLKTQLDILEKTLKNAKTSLDKDVQKSLEKAIQNIKDIQTNHFSHIETGLKTLDISIKERSAAEKEADESLNKIALAKPLIQEKIDQIQLALEDETKKAEELSILAEKASEPSIINSIQQVQSHSQRTDLPDDIKKQLEDALESVRPLKETWFTKLEELNKLIMQRSTEEAKIIAKNATDKLAIEEAFAQSLIKIEEIKLIIQNAESKISKDSDNTNLTAAELKNAAEEINQTKIMASEGLQIQKELLEHLLETAKGLQNFDPTTLGNLNTTISEVGILQTNLSSLENGKKKLEVLAEEREKAEKEADETEKTIIIIKKDIENKIAENQELFYQKITAEELDKGIKTTVAFEENITERLKTPQEHSNRKNLLPSIKERLDSALTQTTESQANLKTQLIQLNNAHLARNKKDEETAKTTITIDNELANIENSILGAVDKANITKPIKARDLNTLVADTIQPTENKAGVDLTNQERLLQNIDKTGLDSETTKKLNETIDRASVIRENLKELEDKRKKLEEFAHKQDLNDKQIMLSINGFDITIDSFNIKTGQQIDTLQHKKQSAKEIATLVNSVKSFVEKEISDLKKQLEHMEKTVLESTSDEAKKALTNIKQKMNIAIETQQKALDTAWENLNNAFEKQQKENKQITDLTDRANTAISAAEEIQKKATQLGVDIKNLLSSSDDLKATKLREALENFTIEKDNIILKSEETKQELNNINSEPGFTDDIKIKLNAALNEIQLLQNTGVPILGEGLNRIETLAELRELEDQKIENHVTAIEEDVNRLIINAARTEAEINEVLIAKNKTAADIRNFAEIKKETVASILNDLNIQKLALEQIEIKDSLKKDLQQHILTARTKTKALINEMGEKLNQGLDSLENKAKNIEQEDNELKNIIKEQHWDDIEKIEKEIIDKIKLITDILESSNLIPAYEPDELAIASEEFRNKMDMALKKHLKELGQLDILETNIEAKSFLDQTIEKANNAKNSNNELINLIEQLKNLSLTRKKEGTKKVAEESLLIVEQLIEELQYAQNEMQENNEPDADALEKLATKMDGLIQRAESTLSEQRYALETEKQYFEEEENAPNIDSALSAVDKAEKILQNIKDATNDLRSQAEEQRIADKQKKLDEEQEKQNKNKELDEAQARDNKQKKSTQENKDNQEETTELKLSAKAKPNPIFELAIKKDAAGKWSLEKRNDSASKWEKHKDLDDMPKEATLEELVEALKSLIKKPPDNSNGLVGVEFKQNEVPPIIIIRVKSKDPGDALEMATNIIEQATRELKAKEEAKLNQPDSDTSRTGLKA